MSIEKLLKLAEEKKKAEKAKLELVPNPNSEPDGVSKSKQQYDSVSKGKQEQAKVSKQKQNNKVETSPTKNYTKVPNSITKLAIPEKFFRGLSKHTYDILYQQTRGAIVPKRTVQLTKDELVEMTGLSKDAIKLHIKYLKEAGLIKNRPTIGSRAGWEYEVFVPEEIDDFEVGVIMGKYEKVSVSKWGQNLRLPTVQNLPLLTPTNPLENKGLTDFLRLSLNTKTNDDEKTRTFSAFIEKFAAASERLTGKNLNPREFERWGDLADLLILELEKASKRTDGISSIPAFLTEVCRRKFFAAPEIKTTKTKIDVVGKSESGNYEIKPLDEAGREAALLELREFADEDFLDDFKKWYVADDWNWLIEKLEESKKGQENNFASDNEEGILA